LRRGAGVVESAQGVDPGEVGAREAAGRGAGGDDDAVGGDGSALVEEHDAAAGVEFAGEGAEKPLGVEIGDLIGVGEDELGLVGAAGE
jgi:hypothetical protein